MPPRCRRRRTGDRGRRRGRRDPEPSMIAPAPEDAPAVVAASAVEPRWRPSPWPRPSPSPWRRPSPSPWRRGRRRARGRGRRRARRREAVAEPVARPSPSPWREAVAEPVAEAVPEPVAAEPEPVVRPAPSASAPRTWPTRPRPRSPRSTRPVASARPEPSTMEELLAEQDTDIRSFKHGDVVEGTDRPDRQGRDPRRHRGQERGRGLATASSTVGTPSPRPSSPSATWSSSTCSSRSRRRATSSCRCGGPASSASGARCRSSSRAGVIIEAPVIDHNKGGLIVDCGIRGFVPISQIVDFPRRPQNEQPRDAAQEIAEKLQPYVGRKLRLKILEVNRKANRLILSEKVALYEERREKRDELFSSLQVGQKVKGTVRSIAPFGVFIDLGGIDGLVHKSELSWNKVNNPESGYKVGEEVEAEVIDINHERGRISLSIRRLQPDPWHSTVADFKVGDDHRRHGHQARQLRRLRPRPRRSRGPDPHQRALPPARRPSGRRRPRGPDAQAQDHLPRLRAASPRPQPQAGRGAAGSAGAEPDGSAPTPRPAERAARRSAATRCRTPSRSPKAGSTTRWPRRSPRSASSSSRGRGRRASAPAEAPSRGRAERRRPVAEADGCRRARPRPAETRRSPAAVRGRPRQPRPSRAPVAEAVAERRDGRGSRSRRGAGRRRRVAATEADRARRRPRVRRLERQPSLARPARERDPPATPAGRLVDLGHGADRHPIRPRSTEHAGRAARTLDRWLGPRREPHEPAAGRGCRRGWVVLAWLAGRLGAAQNRRSPRWIASTSSPTARARS